MPHSLARTVHSGTGGFGLRFPTHTDRWPASAAVATILLLSAVGWAALIQGGRALLALAG